MKLVFVLFLLLCAFSVGHSLRCFSCNTDKLFCPPKIITCPLTGDPEQDKCISLTKNKHKYKGCDVEFEKMLVKSVIGKSSFIDTLKKLHPPSTQSTCDTDLCNGSGKLSKKIQIVSVVAGVIFVLSHLF